MTITTSFNKYKNSWVNFGQYKFFCIFLSFDQIRQVPILTSPIDDSLN